MRMRWIILCVASGAAAALNVAPGKAQIIGEPPTTSAGAPVPFNEGGILAGSGDLEFQQVYASSNFSGPINIQSLTFYSTQCCAGSINLPLFSNGIFSLSLSTTSVAVGALSLNLASNIGADNTTVFIGTLPPATVPSLNFHYSLGFVLPSPFLYDPSQGNLLLDVFNGGETVAGDGDMDVLVNSLPAFSEAYVSSNGVISNVVNNGLTTGFNATNVDGLTNFTATFCGSSCPPPPVLPSTPEPSTWALMLLGFVGLGFAFRKSRCNASLA